MSVATERVEAEYQEERRLTERWKQDIIGLLTGDTSATRRQLAGRLKEKLRWLEAEIDRDRPRRSVVGY